LITLILSERSTSSKLVVNVQRLLQDGHAVGDRFVRAALSHQDHLSDHLSGLEPFLCSLLQAASPPSPDLDIGPIPDHAHREDSYWIWEIGVAPTPVVNGLRLGESKASSNLRGSYKLSGIELSQHGPQP
jgi:hypothetical protein